MTKVLIVMGVILLGAGAYSAYSLFPGDTMSPAEIKTEDTDDTGREKEFSFNTPKKSAHYETNTPEHGALLAAAPINVVIDFNFDLAKPSEIKILNDGKDYGTGETIIDANKLTLRRALNANAPDGLYTVEYNACWPDGSCHDGHFEFAIDRTRATFQRQEGGEVVVRMSEIAFKPKEMIVSAGTKITWINDDAVSHYVNTDSHPAHTYYLGQNSRELKKGDTYSVVFSKPGIYPYHCSAHADSMKGSIIVE